MISALRWVFLFTATFLSAQAAPVKTQTPLPATLDAVTFEFKTDNQQHKTVVMSTPTMLRVDEPADGYSLIVDPVTQQYIGLEHRNYTWWNFSWPQVRDSVARNKPDTHLLDPGNYGINAGNPSTPQVPTSTSLDEDDSGYVWRSTLEKKRVEGYDCVRWTGDTVSGENVEAWCYAGVLPKVEAAIAALHQISQPASLAAMRTVAPDLIFPVYHALAKGGVTPIQINWGDGQTHGTFRLTGVETREAKPALFAVPKLYIKTTLVSLDGLIDQQPARVPRKTEPQKTWQNP